MRVPGPGVSVLETGLPLPSPNLTSASTARSRLPLTCLSTSELRLLSPKPISLKLASFASKLLLTLVILIPNSWLGLLLILISFGLVGSLADRSLPLKAGESGGVKSRSCLEALGKTELAERRLKPNFLPGLGGKGGGSSLQLPVPVLPVLCLAAAGPAFPAVNALCSYFCRMYFSSAASTSSASIGKSARTFFGLKRLLLSTLPTFFMLSTCSADHWSILKLLTFETCVPSLRCRAAHRMHKKMPRFHDAQPGFFALQSAHLSLPGTERSRSCNARSLRACCRFDIADAIVDGRGTNGLVGEC